MNLLLDLIENYPLYRGKLFYRLIQQAIEIGPIAKSEVIEKST